MCPVRCAPVASPANKFAEIVPRSDFLLPRAINEYDVFYPGHKETLSPVVLGKNDGSH